MKRSAELKRELVALAQSRRFEPEMKALSGEAFPSDLTLDSDQDAEAMSIAFLEFFLLQHRFEDGRTLVETFVDEHPELSDAEAEMLCGWVDPIDEIVQIERVDGQSLVATSLLNDLTYRIRSNMGARVFRAMAPGSFVVLSLVPVLDEWLTTGTMRPFPAEYAEAALALAARRATSDPNLVFRNPGLLESAWQKQRDDRSAFVGFFGGDVVILPAAQVRSRYLDFRASQEGGGPNFAWELDEFEDADVVAMIYDEDEGLGFFTRYDDFLRGFEAPDEVDRAGHAELVRSYLDDESILGAPLRRPAILHPDTADEVYARALERPGFTWEKDGEALLLEFKPWLAAGQRPSFVGLTERVAEHVSKHGVQ